MASKKFTFLLGMFCLLSLTAFSQVGVRSYEDSSVIPSKRLPQHTEFLNGTYNYPAKPRNQWEVGVKVGKFTVSGDVPSLLLTPGFGVHIRKALGYTFSLRAEYMYGIGKGLHYSPAAGYSIAENSRAGNPWYQAGYGQGNNSRLVYYNYRTVTQDLSLQGVITLNNIRFHKAQTGVTFYGFGGIGASIYETHINARNEDAQNSLYNFDAVSAQFAATNKNKKDIRKELKDVMDNSYETKAENHGDYRAKLFGQTVRPTATIGAGVAIKLGPRFNLALEDRHTFIKDDLLDGQRWQERQGLTGDFDSYNFASLGLNYNIGAKATEPLYWLNPLDYAYQEIRNPKLMKIPDPVLPDADGDGVTDQFDQEQTPAGCPVDSHGVSLDTDGDGVPDCKDKELITPTYCQPVDADGVGKCPVPCPGPECEGWGKTKNECADKLGLLPSISFKAGSNSLSADAEAVLATVAGKMKNTPECKVVVVGYCSSSKKEQQLSWDHVNKVITYLVEKQGISEDRFIFNYGQEGGDCNTVDLRAATGDESGPARVEAPHPNLRKK